MLKLITGTTIRKTKPTRNVNKGTINLRSPLKRRLNSLSLHTNTQHTKLNYLLTLPVTKSFNKTSISKLISRATLPRTPRLPLISISVKVQQTRCIMTSIYARNSERTQKRKKLCSPFPNLINSFTTGKGSRASSKQSTTSFKIQLMTKSFHKLG